MNQSHPVCALSRLALLLMAGWLSLSVSPAASADAIDEYMRTQLQRYAAPGLALAVVKDGMMVRANGYGYANLEHLALMRADTVFQSASTGKMFTAVAAMLLVEDGKLTLDDSIRTYLPDAPATWQPITLRHLLNHVSGLERSARTDERADYSNAQLLEIYYRASLQSSPGQRFSYSNVGYDLVGLLVQRLSGERSYAELLRKRVFEPLGMVTARSIEHRAVIVNRAAGYQVGADGELVNQDYESTTLSAQGASGLYLSVLDYAKWETAVRSRKILSEASWREIFRPARLASGKNYPYGFGWYLETPRRMERYHSGGHLGFGSFYLHFLEPRLGVIVLANRPGVDREEIARTVAGLIDPKLARASALPIADKAPDVTKRLRQLLAPAQLPDTERAAFATPDLEYRLSVYHRARAPLGALQELSMFAVDEIGDERVYLYRARFAHDIAEVQFTLGTDDRIRGLGLAALASWDAPL